jgi:hypothetical protein
MHVYVGGIMYLVISFEKRNYMFYLFVKIYLQEVSYI